MEEIGALMQGFSVILTPMNIGLMFVGIILGVLIGVLPGLGGANGVAILLPLTFTMSPTSAIIMLSCIYWGALFGGAITSVLFNIPGEPNLRANFATSGARKVIITTARKAPTNDEVKAVVSAAPACPFCAIG